MKMKGIRSALAIKATKKVKKCGLHVLGVCLLKKGKYGEALDLYTHLQLNWPRRFTFGGSQGREIEFNG
jgi:hypothetical protein